MAEYSGCSHGSNWTETWANSSRQTELIILLVRCSQALVRQNVIQALGCMITRIESGPCDITAFSSLFLDSLLRLLAFWVSFKVTESFSYPTFALMRLTIWFAWPWRWQTGASNAWRENSWARGAIKIQWRTVTICDCLSGRGPRSSFFASCSLIAFLTLTDKKILKIWHSLQEDFRIVRWQSSISDRLSSCLDMSFKDQIVGCRHMIMLVSFYTLPCVVNINIVLLKLLQYVYIDGCWIDSDLGTRKFRQSLSL